MSNDAIVDLSTQLVGSITVGRRPDARTLSLLGMPEAQVAEVLAMVRYAHASGRLDAFAECAAEAEQRAPLTDAVRLGSNADGSELALYSMADWARGQR